MNNLFTYISAVKEVSDKLSIIEKIENKHSFEEDGIITQSCELVITFENGVALRKQTEQDFSGDTGITDTVCAECWITYEVIAQPDHLEVMPKKKSFTNPCQEVFWIKINQAQS